MRIFLITFLVILLSGLFAWLLNQAQNAGSDVPEGKLLSLSFAPFRQGQSPLKEIFPSLEEIDEDLRLMADKTHSIRTYSSSEIMQSISNLAGKYGLQMTQGAWLGFDKEANDTEIAALIQSANSYPDVVKRVIVGNEILLRGEMKPEILISYIRQVRKAVKQPVSYADVWSMYMKYPQLIKEVDFITIHILPYWEDEPIAVDAAPQHIERIYKEVQSKAETIVPGKSILIGEAGWPSYGRQRGRAVPGVVNEARFIRGLIHTANKNGFDYNIIEAFNQPWKSELEGVVGGNWGLFSDERKQVFPLTGPVYENPHWYLRWLAAIIIVLVVTAAYRNRLQKLTPVKLVVLIGFLQLNSTFLVTATDYLWYTSYSFWQHLNTVFLVLFNVLMSSLILRQAYKVLSGSSGTHKAGRVLYLLYFLTAVLAIYKTYGLANYGRYLSFPSELAYIPVTGIVGLVFMRYISERQFSFQAFDLNRLLDNPAIYTIRDKMTGYVLVFIGIALIYGETRAFMFGRDFIIAYPDFAERLKMALIFTLTNGQLLVWLFCLFMLATPFLVAGRKNAKQK
ncbi:MAG: exo-beta-1,3-glucanase [Gammaproteobacteria bacterium]|nr:exo-beta-1,3-glucanase [Gammaproteobacteria bacterium]